MKKKVLVISSGDLRSFSHSIPYFAAIRKHHKDDQLIIFTEQKYYNFCKSSGYFNKGIIDNKP